VVLFREVIIIEYKLNPQKNEEIENAETTTTCAETYLEKMTKSKRKDKVEERRSNRVLI